MELWNASKRLIFSDFNFCDRHREAVNLQQYRVYNCITPQREFITLLIFYCVLHSTGEDHSTLSDTQKKSMSAFFFTFILGKQLVPWLQSAQAGHFEEGVLQIRFLISWIAPPIWLLISYDRTKYNNPYEPINFMFFDVKLGNTWNLLVGCGLICS